MTTGSHWLRPAVKHQPSHVVRKVIYLRKAGVCLGSPSGDKGRSDQRCGVRLGQDLVPDLYYYKYPTEQRQMRQETLVRFVEAPASAKQAGVLHAKRGTAHKSLTCMPSLDRFAVPLRGNHLWRCALRNRAVILLFSSTLAVMSVACSRINSSQHSESPQAPVATVPTPSPPADSADNPEPVATPSSQPKLSDKEAYEQAVDAALSAESIGQSAQSPDDWRLVISRLQEAIKLLNQIPSSSPYHAPAQSKLAQYQKNLRLAQQRSTHPGSSSASKTAIALTPGTVFQPVGPSSQTPGASSPTAKSTPEADSTDESTDDTESTTNTASPQIFKAPIKRRMHQTPVIDVTFNGKQTFEMVVDTGASGTVITQAMAQRLGITPSGEVTASTASAKGVKLRTGKVQSIAVAGAVVKDVQVAIGSPDLEIGLLGQDFYSKYDVLIRQNVVEFHPRSS
ncbi:MAG TPA: retroviral-like aspartic protease family protein [Allocoleopsis sp.]